METSRAGCNYCARQKTEPLAAVPLSNDCATAAEAMSRRNRNCSRREAGSVSPCTAAAAERDSRTSSTKSAR